MADVTLTYKGSTIAEINATGSKTLKTSGKYCEGDIGVNYVKPSGSGGSTDNEDAIISRTITSYSNSRITSLGWYAFYGCSNLTSISLPLVATSGGNAFTACNQLADVQIPLLTEVTTNMFMSCSSLVKIKLPVLQNINQNGFAYSGSLETLILPNTQMCTLSNKNALRLTSIEKGTGYIYVPQSLIEDYKAATNWVTFAAQFRAIEDYPDICGEVTT